MLKLPGWLERRREDAPRFARGWHENEAAADEAADRWFAAAFHLRWLRELEPGDARWRERLAIADTIQRLADGENRAAASRLLVKDAGAGTWSPDNTRIAFTDLKSPAGGIRILTLASGDVEELTQTGKDPAWSPGEGQFIAFTDKKADPDQGIWIADLPTKQTKRLARGEFAGWLSDGKTICFRTSIAGKPVVQSLVVTDDPAVPKTLLTGCDPTHPAVSPDGQYVVAFAAGELQIWSVAKQQIVERHALPDWHEFLPAWSADSQQVAFGFSRADGLE